MEKARSRKVTRKKAQTKKVTRVTVDFPKAQHRRLKAMAALAGVTLQEYIRTHIMEKVEETDISDAKFKVIKKKIMEENSDVLKRLADQ